MTGSFVLKVSVILNVGSEDCGYMTETSLDWCLSFKITDSVHKNRKWPLMWHSIYLTMINMFSF